jgi:hypothetical protein
MADTRARGAQEEPALGSRPDDRAGHVEHGRVHGEIVACESSAPIIAFGPALRKRHRTRAGHTEQFYQKLNRWAIK